MRELVYFNTGAMPSWVGVAWSDAAWKREMRRLKVAPVEWPPFIADGANAGTHWFEHPKHGKIVLMSFNAKDLATRKLPQIVGLFAHEVTHVWQRMLTLMREKQPGIEVEAYHIQWWTQCLMHSYLTDMKGTWKK